MHRRSAAAAVILAIICCSLPCSMAVQVVVHPEGDRREELPPSPWPARGVRCGRCMSPNAATTTTASALLTLHHRKKTLQKKHAVVVDLYYTKAPPMLP
ncbi:hypothetical protein BRADI_2g01103v3 [Brachypodium distachyon]|uniref:Secreted protein n=1 Tax=Brachypodium distachyon TaxID=15368 RepID=A0A2K2D6C1_BRADI|nr:hypothetical protein BRADI_2g01103v3 [Brachypodium distachyon]